MQEITRNLLKEIEVYEKSFSDKVFLWNNWNQYLDLKCDISTEIYDSLLSCYN